MFYLQQILAMLIENRKYVQILKISYLEEKKKIIEQQKLNILFKLKKKDKQINNYLPALILRYPNVSHIYCGYMYCTAYFYVK